MTPEISTSTVAPWSPYQPPAGCASHARVFTYGPVGSSVLADAFAANPSVCADYYIHLAALAADKTQPRGPQAVDDLHARGQQFHALAEFSWGAWSAVAGMTWAERALEFRARMLAKGYDPTRDAWAINELPSTVRSDPQVRKNVREVVQALYENAGKTPANGGYVWIVGMSSGLANPGVYKGNLEDWLVDDAFWKTMNQYVRWWGQETYASPPDVCVGAAKVGERAAAVNDYAMHVAKLAAAGPAGAAAARAFFGESYVPTQSAFWRSDIYGTQSMSLDQMKHYVSTNLYASRAWAANHAYPDGRFAIAWNDSPDGVPAADTADLAHRIAMAVHDAYDVGAPPAAKACSPTGSFAWCKCDVAGAAFNGAWSAFEQW